MDQLAIAATWGTINCFRGWGNGWGGNNVAWLVWIQSKILNRYILTILQALVTVWYMHSLGFDNAALWASFGALAAGWMLGVISGWGDYFDGKVYQNDEISWIDDFVVWFSRFLTPKQAQSAYLIDNISMGLRGAFYLPLFIGLGLATESWWLALPALLFWQDGMIYGFWRWLWPQSDFVRPAEIASGAVRGWLVAAALYLAA